MKKLIPAGIALAVAGCAFSARAQSVAEVADTLSHPTDSASVGMLNPYGMRLTPRPVVLNADGAGPFMTPQVAAALSPIVLGLRPGEIAAWRSGMVGGYVDIAHMPGMGAIESGRLYMGQGAGRFSFTAFAAVEKYGFFRGLERSLGTGGSLSFRINNHLSMTVFGQYYTSPGAMPYAMTAYTSTSSFGGYLNYRISDHWGVKAGAQSFRSNLTGHWQTQPMLIPYYRTDSGAEIGVDVGGIIYNILRSSSVGRDWGSRNPTIPPPDVIRAGAYRP